MGFGIEEVLDICVLWCEYLFLFFSSSIIVLFGYWVSFYDSCVIKSEKKSRYEQDKQQEINQRERY